ncbi:lytic transglycosylase domain-containing protein [Salmonella enterica subsp. enterica serovar Newport]|nr:lytic transglycosylase domain-containing protein [Salmonella enterica subsp. enterica serovar Newport]EHG5855228.1 lytic transglycosylase domain-containing protein [Salmonella enterica subsp. enterica serovar Newport]
MAGNQLPVLTLDFDAEKIKKLQEISDKFKEAFAIGPGGKPLPGGSHTPSVPSTWGDKGNKRVPETQFDKFLKGLNKDAQGTLKTFGLINKTLQTTTSRLKGLFQTTISWGVKIAAIGGGGGMFGYGYMTNHVAQQYRSSQGLGVTTGQMQAASAVYGTRISNTGNIMQALANAQDNPGDPNYSALMALNINPRDGAAANMPKLFERVTSLLKQYKDTGVSQSILKAYRLDGMIDVATANQILANSDRFPQLNQQFAEQSQKLDSAMGSGTQQKYQDLSARFAINANRIGNSFIKALARLSGPIGRISDNLTASIERFLNGRNGQALFDTLASGLEKLGKWLGSDDFQTDLKTFAICVKKIITAIGDVISWIAGTTGGVDFSGTGVGADKADQALVNFGNKYLGGHLPGANPLTNKYTGIFTQDRVYDGYQMPDVLKGNIQNFVNVANDTYRLPKGLMSAIAQKESSWNPFAVNKKSGAAGLFQFMPGTAKAYGLEGNDVFDPNKATVAAGRYLNDLNKRYKGDVAKMLTAYNGGRIDNDGNLSLKKETVDYLIKILPKVQGALEQHPGIMWQLSEARSNLATGGKNDRAIIQLQIEQKPGSDIIAQIAGQSIPR